MRLGITSSLPLTVPHRFTNTSQIINKIFGMYATRGQRHYGEDVTELQHALQCAYLARRAGDSPHLVAACLLHDYGHLLHDHAEDIAEHGVNTQHEILGANELAQYFLPLVTEPIRLHVAAKRFLCWREPEYLAGLSAASQLSLQLQGGVMNETEADEFSRNAHSHDAVWLRRYDDAAKIKEWNVPTLESYCALLEAFIAN